MGYDLHPSNLFFISHRKMILVYITCESESEAERISEHLLSKRLVACVNMFPIKSMFWWGGAIKSEEEVVVIAKTLEGRFDEVRGEIERIHSYEIPCILKMGVEASKEFREWVGGEVK
jgi:periplasmic divalent cation tolerance protein